MENNVNLRLFLVCSIIITSFAIPSVFGEEVKKVPFNAYVNDLYGFSIIPPEGWDIDENFQFDNDRITLVSIWNNQTGFDIKPQFSIDYEDNGAEFGKMISQSTTTEVYTILDNMDLGNYGKQTKVVDKSLRSFDDRKEITIQFLSSEENYDGEIITAQSATIFLWYYNGEAFVFNFWSTPEYEENYEKFRESLDTFYVGKVEKLPSPKPDFVDPEKDPQYYLDRYYNEPEYKAWFDRNYPDYTIEEAVNFKPESKIPEWVKGIFTFYADGKINDDELIKALQFLIKEGIIEV